MSRARRPAAGRRDRLGPGGGRPVVVDAGERRVHGDDGRRSARARSSVGERRASPARTAAPGPGSSRARASVANDRAGKLRFRSTSRAEFLRPRARPSGLTAGSSQTGRAGAAARRRARGASSISASTLAGSSPWMPPNTSSGGPGAAEAAPANRRAPRSICPSASNPSAVHGVSRRACSHWIPFHAPANVRAMAIKLRDLKTEARTLARAEQYAAALAAHDHMLAANPLDYDSRRKIADLLLALGDQAGARRGLPRGRDARRALGPPAARRSSAARCSSRWAATADEIVAVMAATYAHDAPALAKFAARQAPVDLDARDRAAPGRRAAGDPARGRAPGARSGHATCPRSSQYPEQFLPVPFFSELPRERCFPPAIQSLRLVRAGDGDVVIREGEPGTAFYFVATGEVRVFARAGNNKAVERGRLHEGSLFGEMALVTEQARTASVQVVGEADLLEVDRAAVARAGRRGPGAGRAARSLRARAPAQEPARDVAAVQAVRSPAADGAAQALRGPRGRARHGDHPRGRRRPGAVRRSCSARSRS